MCGMGIGSVIAGMISDYIKKPALVIIIGSLIGTTICSFVVLPYVYTQNWALYLANCGALFLGSWNVSDVLTLQVCRENGMDTTKFGK